MRTFVDKATGKTWAIKLDENKLMTSNNGGKQKETVLDTPEAAQKKYEKDMWAKLRKGFVLHDAQAKKGQAVMHKFVGSGYTGFMPVSAIEDSNSFYISKVIGEFEREEIMLVQHDGDIILSTPIPKKGGMAYSIKTVSDRLLMMNFDHQIVQFDIINQTLKEYTKHSGKPESTLDIFENKAIGYDRSGFHVFDLKQDRIVYSKSVQCAVYGGHSTQCSAAVHENKIAYCVQPEKIVIIDYTSNKEYEIVKDTNALTKCMSFSPDGKYLFTQEQYGSWNLKCYDAETLNRVEWDSGEVNSYAINRNKQLLATHNRGTVKIYDLKTFTPLISFKLEHIVKNCSLDFTKDFLSVFTDYGCVGLYKYEE